MLTSRLTNRQMKVHETKPNSTEINRLLAAAVVNRPFCNLLLKDPARAIEEGFAGERFALSHEEYNLILSIHVSSLPEFANELSRRLPNYRSTSQSMLSDDL